MEQFHSLGYNFWGWIPWQVSLLVLGLDFGAIMFLRTFIERHFYWSRWWSFRVGDSIGLPVYSGFVSVIIHRNDTADRFYDWTWVHVVILVVGFALGILQEVGANKSGMLTLRQSLVPSQLYHTLIFGVMVYIMASGAMPALIEHNPPWAVAGAAVGMAIYIGSFVYDGLFVDKSPITEF